MFWHNLKYEVLSGLRVKDVLFWLILFPIVLATFFKIAFGSIYEKTTLFSTIPVAVVETTEQPVLHTVLDNLERTAVCSDLYRRTDRIILIERTKSGWHSLRWRNLVAQFFRKRRGTDHYQIFC